MYIKVRQRYTEPKEKSGENKLAKKRKENNIHINKQQQQERQQRQNQCKQANIIIFKTIIIIRQLGKHLTIKQDQCYLIDKRSGRCGEV